MLSLQTISSTQLNCNCQHSIEQKKYGIHTLHLLCMHAASLYFLTHITNVWGCMEILPTHCGAGSVKVNYYRSMRKIWGLVKPQKVNKLQMRLSYHRIYFKTVCNMKKHSRVDRWIYVFNLNGLKGPSKLQWLLCKEILKKFVRVVSEIYRKALKVQILNEVTLIQVVRKRVRFQDRMNESTPKFPSIKIWY